MTKSKNRPLSKEEVEIAKKQIGKIDKKNEWLSFQIEYYDLMLNKGLEQNYLKTIREYKEAKKAFVDELNLNQNIVNELNDQIKNGVEIKNIEPVDNKVDDESKRDYIK